MITRVPSVVHQSRLLRLNIGELLAVATLGALALEPLLGSLAAGSFLLFGLLLLASQPVHSLSSLVRYWPLLLLPAYCLLSTLWSDFPDSTLRYSTQLAVTLAIAIVIACRVSSESLLRGLFCIYSLGIVLSLVIGRNSDGSAWLGIFGSKNAFAAFVSVFAVISVGVAFDKGAVRGLRVAGLVGAVLSLPLLIRAQSAGALAVIGPAVLSVLAVMLIRRLSAPQKLVVLAAVVFAVLVGALVFATYGTQLLGAFLETSGKDSTLTGRTDLWRTGLTLISDKPFLGVGYRAFWVKGNGPAEELWAMFGEPSGAGFNFHNLYISNAVDLGLVGLSIEVALIYLTASILVVLAFVRPTHVVAALLGLHLLLILRSFVEVEVFFEFSVRTVLAYCTVVYAAREFLHWRATRQVPLSSRAYLARGTA
jgi:exopolysaccharide production protein ExoQ